MTTIMVDMDGVVADFDEYARVTLDVKESHHKWPPTEWIKLKSNPRLYRDLLKTPYADQLVEICRGIAYQKNWDLRFLTAIPSGNDVHWAFYDKVIWAQKNFPGIPVHFGPYSADKHVHCKPGDILIDDRQSNIEAWISAGGIGIYHTNIEVTLDELKKATV